MRYRLHLNAFDIGPLVAFSLVLLDDGETPEDKPARVLDLSDTLTGVGESDVHEWLRDVLVALLERT